MFSCEIFEKFKNISTERKVFFKRNNFIQSNISINILLKILTLHAF